ncbi:MAG: efflux RND transporter periplasmic adaptor subunit [Endozoicomonas sp.]
MQGHPVRQLFLAMALSTVLYNGTVSAQQSAPVVPAVAVSAQPIHFEKSYVGRAVPVDHVKITTKVAGEIQSIHFKEGSFVQEGDVLFRLDPEPYELALESAQAALQATLAQNENAQITLKRSEELIKTNAISRQLLLDHQAAARTATANVSKARAAMKTAELSLRYTKIVAPVSGRVGSRSVSVGDLVGTAPPVRVMTEMMVMDPINVEMAVNEKDLLNKVVDHTDLTLTLANGDVYPLTGRVDFVDNHVSPNNSTIQVRASFSNPDNQLVPGLFVNVKATDTRAQNLIAIPQRAVMENQSGRFVYVADAENSVVVRPVQTGPRIGVQWVINEGLEEGDVVLTSNLQLLRPGQEVTLNMAEDA